MHGLYLIFSPLFCVIVSVFVCGGLVGGEKEMLMFKIRFWVVVYS